jgi:hypothetical protein
VNQQVVDVLERRELAGGFVLAIHGRNRDDRLDVEIEFEFLLEVVRVVLEPIERGCDGRRLTPARVAHHRDVVHVHAVVERSAGRLVELLPRLQMFQAAARRVRHFPHSGR